MFGNVEYMNADECTLVDDSENDETPPSPTIIGDHEISSLPENMEGDSPVNDFFSASDIQGW